MKAGILLLLKEASGLTKPADASVFGGLEHSRRTYFKLCDKSEIIIIYMYLNLSIKPKFITATYFLISCSTATRPAQPPGFHAISGQHGYNVSD